MSVKAGIAVVLGLLLAVALCGGLAAETESEGCDAWYISEGTLHIGAQAPDGVEAVASGTFSLNGYSLSYMDGNDAATTPWHEQAAIIERAIIHAGCARPESTAFWFFGLSDMGDCDAAGLDTSGIRQMESMFEGCASLTSLDVSKWDTSKVASMQAMFSGCTSLTGLDVSGWDTSNVNNMADMFRGCAALKSLDVSGWNTSNVTDMFYLFDSCKALSHLDVSKWDTSNVKDMPGLFSGCESLKSLDLSGWDTANVTNLEDMFRDCSRLARLALGAGFLLDEEDGSANLPAHDWTRMEDGVVCPTSELVGLAPAQRAGTWILARYYGPGDVNGNGIAEAEDVRMILKAVVGTLSLEEGGEAFGAADMNGDEEITTKDAVMVLKSIG